MTRGAWDDSELRNVENDVEVAVTTPPPPTHTQTHHHHHHHHHHTPPTTSIMMSQNDVEVPYLAHQIVLWVVEPRRDPLHRLVVQENHPRLLWAAGRQDLNNLMSMVEAQKS